MNDMLNMTENYVEETIELIKLAGHVVADRLVFEPLSDTLLKFSLILPQEASLLVKR